MREKSSTVKVFTAKTRGIVVTRRSEWMKRNRERIVCHRNKSVREMIELATREGVGKHGFWNISMAKRKKSRDSWIAMVRVRGMAKSSDFLR